MGAADIQLVWFYLLRECRSKGVAKVAVAKMSDKTGLSERVVKSTVEKLESAGIIKIVAMADNDGMSIPGKWVTVAGIENLVAFRTFTSDIEVATGGHGIDFDKFKDFFNDKMKNSVIPKINAVTPKRKSLILARLKDRGITKQTLCNVIERAATSSFLNGDNDQGWRASFDWIFKQANFYKILEGNYDNRNSGKTQQQSSGRGQHRNPTALDLAREILGESSG